MAIEDSLSRAQANIKTAREAAGSRPCTRPLVALSSHGPALDLELLQATERLHD